MFLYKHGRSKKTLSFVRIASAVLVLGLLIIAVAETASYLYVAQLPQSVSSKIDPSVDKLAAVLGMAKSSLESLDKIGNVETDDNDKSATVNTPLQKEEGSTDAEQVAATVARFALLSDSHNDLEYLKKAVDKAKDYQVDQIAFLGDYTDWGELVNLQKAKEIMDASQIPYISLPGDHDLGETRDESNFKKVFGRTYGILELEDVKFVYFDNSKNFTLVSDDAVEWFSKEIQGADFLFLSQPLMTSSMSRVMGIVDGVKDAEVYTQNRELLEMVRGSNVKGIISGDLHQFLQYDDPVKENLRHYSVGAVLKSQSLEKLNLQTPRFAILTIGDDLSYEILDVPID